MTDADWPTPAQRRHYREMASTIRALIPTLTNPESRQELLLLVAGYERLADYVEGGAPVGGRAPAAITRS
jgi:hypothetical protein